MTITLEYSQECLKNNLDNLSRISEEVSLDKLALPKFVWAEKTVIDLYSELLKSETLLTDRNLEPLIRLDALCYAYPEVQAYLNFRSSIESLLDHLNDIAEDEIDLKLNSELREILTDIRGQFGISPQTLEHVRLFRQQDCHSFESPIVDIQGLRKALYIVSSELLSEDKD